MQESYNKILIFITLILISIYESSALTYPQPYNLSQSNYEMKSWSESAPAATYPPSMIFHQISKLDPKLDDEVSSDWTLPYNLSTKSRINGENDLGFSFYNTSTANDSNCWVGAATLALSTIGCQSILVGWTGRTISPKERIYAIELQYRTGDTGLFKSMNCSYSMSQTANDSTRFDSIPLPAEAGNCPLVQLRWKYYFVSGTTGSRARLGVDDIVVSIPRAANAIDDQQNYSKTTTSLFLPSYYSNSVLRLFTSNRIQNISSIIIYNTKGNTYEVAQGGIDNQGSLEFDLNSLKLPTGAYYVLLRSRASCFKSRFIVY